MCVGVDVGKLSGERVGSGVAVCVGEVRTQLVSSKRTENRESINRFVIMNASRLYPSAYPMQDLCPFYR